MACSPAARANAGHGEADTARSLGDERAALEGAVDALDRIVNLNKTRRRMRRGGSARRGGPRTMVRRKQEDICGTFVPALNIVGDACVNHFSDMRLYLRRAGADRDEW